MRRRLIAGNWKMNAPADPAGFVDAIAAARGHRDDVGALICPPFPLIHALVGRGLRIGAQDCHAEASGAHTGDVSAEILAAAGVGHVIVGHSERRAAYGETDALVRAKAAAAHRADLTAIICVGETGTERREGRAADVVAAQLSAALPASATAVNTVIAYEPVWAIGTGAAATTDDIAEMHQTIRAEAAGRLGATVADHLRILYGGSMNGANAPAILEIEDVDGGLVGGASLRTDEFLAIFAAA